MHYKSNHHAAWRRWLLGLAVVTMPMSIVAAPRVDFGHYAPGAPMVSLEIDGETVVSQLEYRGYQDRVNVAPGTRHLVVRGTGGQVITERDLELASSDSLVLFFAGDGRPDLPYQVLVSYDHNRPILHGEMSSQSTVLSVVRSDDGELQLTRVGSQCGDNEPTWAETFFSYGTEGVVGDLADRLPRSYAVSGGSGMCSVLLSSSLGSDEPQRYELPFAAGLRLRRVISGDGRNYPLVVDFIEQAIEQTVGVIGATSAIDGLWYDPNNAGSGMLIAHAPTEDDPHHVKAIIYGFGHEAQATWRVIDRDRVFQFAGGDPDGTRAVVGIDRADAEIVFHSCDLASLRAFNIVEFSALPSPRFPRNTIMLRKLIPAGCNPPGVG